MADDNWWASSPFATAASAKAATAPVGRAKTTPQDMQMLRDASTRAETERDARRNYRSTRQAVLDMDTGPQKAAYLNAITSEEGGGFWDGVGSVLGSVARPFVSDKTWAARDHLNTVSAKVALAGAQQMKGTSSDKDTSLMRMGGVSPYKTKRENLRILDEAERDGAFAQHRATLRSKWIARYGSVSAPGPNGMSYEEIAARQDAAVERALAVRKNGLPKPPPSATRRSAGRTVLDLNGNPVR